MPAGHSPLSCVYHCFKAGQHGIVKLAGPTCFKRGAQLVYGFHIVVVLCAVYHNQQVSVALAQQVFQLKHLVIGVYRNQHPPILAAAKMSTAIAAHCRPYGNMISLFYPQSQKRLGNNIAFLIEFLPGTLIIAVGIGNGVALGIILRQLLQYLPQCFMNEFRFHSMLLEAKIPPPAPVLPCPRPQTDARRHF